MLPTATKATTPVSLATFKQWLGITSDATKAITSLTSVGTVATAVCAGHGYQTGAFVTVGGASPAAYNGGALITVVDANTFTYPLAAATTSPATGTPTVTLDDGRYAALVDGAADDFDTFTGVPIVTRSVTDTFSGDGKYQHALSRAPVQAIAAFTVDGQAVDPSTYVLDTDTGIITFTGSVQLTPFTNGAFNVGIMNCVVTFNAGYDVQDGAALPFDVVGAILDLAKATHDALVSNAIAATSVSLGPSSMVIRPAARPQSVQRTFDLWQAKGYRP